MQGENFKKNDLQKSSINILLGKCNVLIKLTFSNAYINSISKINYEVMSYLE